MGCCKIEHTLILTYFEEIVTNRENQEFFLLIIVLLFPFFLKAEELKDVLRDAFKFYPDIVKSKTELKISENDLRISKTDFLPSVIFPRHKAEKYPKATQIPPM